MERSLGGGRHDINFYDVISISNLFTAWKTFRKGKQSKKDVALFELTLEDALFDLHNALLLGGWRPTPYTVFLIHDPKLRRIHKASVRDRILYQAVYQILYQIFDKNFIFDSYSSRDLKGTHRAIKRFEESARKVSFNYRKKAFAVKCDIRKFFDSIDHEILCELIFQKIHDQQLQLLIQKIIGSFSTTPGKGLPLGNVTSQLFANIYLNELDQFVKHHLKVEHYIRYCDDFVMVHESKEFLKKAVRSLQTYLQDSLKLELHPCKVIFKALHQGVDFLGFVSLPHYAVLRTKTKKRILKKIIALKKQLGAKTISKEKFEQVLQSYYGVLSHAQSFKIRQKIDVIIKSS